MRVGKTAEDWGCGTVSDGVKILIFDKNVRSRLKRGERRIFGMSRQWPFRIIRDELLGMTSLLMAAISTPSCFAQYNCTILFSDQSLPAPGWLNNLSSTGWYSDNAPNSSQGFNPYIVSPTGSVTNLMPTGFLGASVGGYSDGFAVGNGTAIGQTSSQPLLWNLNTGTVTTLYPVSAGLSTTVTAASGTYQVGYQSFAGNTHDDPEQGAVAWSGSEASIIQFGRDAIPTAINGTNVVGYSVPDPFEELAGAYPLPPPTQAILWPGLHYGNGIDLNPSFCYDSWAYGVGGDQEVGKGDNIAPWLGQQTQYALLWTGTAASAVILGYGTAFATNGIQQIGQTSSGAVVWSGTADSAVNLNNFLLTDGTWTSAEAESIDQDGNIFGIANGTYDGYTGEFAIEWSPVPEPISISLMIGGLMAVPCRMRHKGQ